MMVRNSGRVREDFTAESREERVMEELLRGVTKTKKVADTRGSILSGTECVASNSGRIRNGLLPTRYTLWQRVSRAMNSVARISVAIILATGLAACGGGDGPVQPPPLVSIGATITGLADGRIIRLVLDGVPSETFAQRSATGFDFVFARELSPGATYNVSIGLNP